MTKKLSNWLEANLKNNINGTLEETIKGLLRLNPPIKKSTVNKQKALKSSMKSLLDNNEKLRKEYETLNNWLIEKENKSNKRKLNVIDETKHAVFKKARISSSVVNIGTGTTSIHHELNSGNISNNRKFGKELQKGNVQDEEKIQEIKGVHQSYQSLSPLISEDVKQEQEIKDEQEIKSVHQSLSPLISEREIPQKFSLTPSEQGSYVEPILQYVERALFKFIANHEKYIPFEVVKNFTAKCNPPRQVNFEDADLLNILNFIIKNITLFTTGHSEQTLFHGEHKIDPSDLFKSFKTEARNHNAHAITQPMGRWNDEELQRLSTLALKIIACLGDNELFDPLTKIRNELNDKLTERLILTIENKDEDHTDLVDFALDNISKIKSSNKEHIKQVLQLAMNKDHTFFNIWKCLAFRKDKRMTVEKFITMMNIQFDMDLEIK